MQLIWFIVVGFLAGLIARALMPGKQSMGLGLTTLLGVIGSFVGGFLSSLFSRQPVSLFRPSGIIGSIIGAFDRPGDLHRREQSPQQHARDRVTGFWS